MQYSQTPPPYTFIPTRIDAKTQLEPSQPGKISKKVDKQTWSSKDETRKLHCVVYESTFFRISVNQVSSNFSDLKQNSDKFDKNICINDNIKLKVVGRRLSTTKVGVF